MPSGDLFLQYRYKSWSLNLPTQSIRRTKWFEINFSAWRETPYHTREKVIFPTRKDGDITYQQCCPRIVLAQTVRAKIPKISQLVGGGTIGRLRIDPTRLRTVPLRTDGCRNDSLAKRPTFLVAGWQWIRVFQPKTRSNRLDSGAFSYQVGTDQVRLGTYPRLGCFRHQVGTPWCSRHWDIRTGYTATPPLRSADGHSVCACAQSFGI